MRNEGVEPFVVTDQATQLAPEPSKFESPPVAGRLFIDEGAGVCEPCRRAEAEAIDVDHVTDGVRRWGEADIFRQWLMAHLEQADAEDEDHTAVRGEPIPVPESAGEPVGASACSCMA